MKAMRVAAAGVTLLAVTLLATTSTVATAAEYPVESVRFDHQGSNFRMIVTSKAPWTHWTLANPPRVILDLNDAVSQLPNAPGLYELELGDGVVQKFRSSQFNNQPGERKVRMTLVLDQAARYEARRVGEEVHVLVQNGPGSAADDADQPVAATALKSLSSALDAVLDDAPSKRPGNAKTKTASATPAKSPKPPAAPASPVVPKTDPTKRPLVEASELPSSLLLAQSLDSNAPNASSAQETEHAGSPVVSKSNPGPATNSPQEPAPSETTKGESSDAQGPGPATLAKSSASNQPVDPRKIARFMEPVMPPAPAPRDLIPLPDDPVESKEVRHRRAAGRLLREAVDALLSGNVKDAYETAERCARFYGTTAPGVQAGVLWRELRRLRQEPPHERLAEVPKTPDPRQIPSEVFVRLVELSLQRGQYDSAEDLLETWESTYARGEWTPRLHLALAEIHYRKRNTEQALHHLGFVDRGDPQESASLLMSARLWDEAGDTKKALDLYRWLAELPAGPEQQRGLARSADLLFQAGRIKESLAMYERLLESEPSEDERAWALYQSGNCQLLLDRPGEAESLYAQVVESHGQSFWSAFAQERLESINWKRDLVRVMRGE